jgi:hypothetical protein
VYYSEGVLREKAVAALAAGLLGEFFSQVGEPNVGETANLLHLAEVSMGWAECFPSRRDQAEKIMKEMQERISRTAFGRGRT